MAVDQQTEEPAGFGRRPAGSGPGGKAAEDKATFRLAAFGALLVVAVFAGYGLGRLHHGSTTAEGPAANTNASSTAASGAATSNTGAGAATTGNADNSMPGMTMDESEPHTHNADGTVTQSAAALPAGSIVGGLSLSSANLTLVPLTTTFVGGRTQRLSFRIVGAGGVPVTTFAVVHDKLLHLIVVRRDLSGYQHIHPTMAPDGTWSIDLTLAQPGIYRMIADFTAIVGGQQVAAALGSDLTVAGAYAPTPLPAPANTVNAGGFNVTYEGAPDTKSVQPILMSVTGPDRKPAALQPYLGAFGHLVMIRQGDLGYVHIHPELQLVDGKVKFWLTAPSQGTYRMFFDFQVAGRVHDAAWTVTIS